MTKRRRVGPALGKKTKVTTGSNYTKLGPKHKSPAAKYRVPVLTDKASPPKPGHRYGPARLGTFMNAERIQREAAEDERKAKLIEWNNIEQERHTNKILKIREIRNQKLSETDYLGASDQIMNDSVKTWRQSLRDIPANHTDEAAYDLLLARDASGNLTHSVWSKP